MKLNRIKAVLSEKGISQTWLAKQLDKSFSMVNAYMLAIGFNLIWKRSSGLPRFYKLI